MDIDNYDRIATDAASLSVSHTATSNSSTVYGLGATSGHALMVLGEMTVRGLDKASIRLRLQRISRAMRLASPDKWPSSCAAELLECQR